MRQQLPLPAIQTLRRKHPTAALLLAYTAAFALLMGVWVALFAANGASFIWYGDTYKQHYPFLVYYGRYLRQAARCLLSGAAVPTFDFSIGYGADIITTLSYYGLGDPLDLLSAFVPGTYTELLLEFLIVLRLYLAGLTFTAFSLRHGNSRFGTLLGALAYVFSAWPIQAGLMEPIFLVPMYCFPLMLLGADDLFEHRKPTVYILSVALAALSNFLFFYMEAVLLVLYAVAVYLKRYGLKAPRLLPPLLARFAGYALMGIAISAVTLLPTATELFSSARFSLDREIAPYSFYRFFQLFANLTTGMSFDAYSTYMGTTAVAFLGVLVLFSVPRRNTVLKCAWLGLLAMLLIPQVGSLLNGGSYVSNRWVWAFLILEAFILARVFPDMATLAQRERCTLFLLLAGYCLISFFYEESRTEAALLGAALLLLLAVFMLVADGLPQRAVRAVLLAGCCLGVVMNLGTYYGIEGSDTVQEYLPAGNAWQGNVLNNPATALNLLDDPGLWRYDSLMGEPINSAMLLHTHGTGYFFSLNNGYLSQLFSELGQNSTAEYDYRGLDCRSPLETLFGVRYMLLAPDSTDMLPTLFDTQAVFGTEIAGQSVALYPNKAALPIGYTTAAQIDRKTYDALSPLQKQDALLDGAVLEDDAGTLLPEAELTGDVVRPEATVTLDGIEKLDDVTYYVPNGGGTITITIDEPMADVETALVVQGFRYTPSNPMDAMTEDSLAAMGPHDRRKTEHEYAHFSAKDYVYLRLLSDFGEGYTEGFIYYQLPKSQYYGGRHDYVYNFGKSDNGLITLKIVLSYAGTYTFSDIAVECQKLDSLVARAEALGAESLQNVTLDTNRIDGEITVSQTELLVMQIPYSDGWSAFVDGKEAQLLRVDTAFTGVLLEPGSHTVAFTYQTPGLTAGTLISAAGLLALAATAWITGRSARKKKNRLQNPV